MTSTHPLTAAIVAARANDFDALRRLVDWPLTGAGRVARAVSGVLEPHRAEVLITGLAQLDEAAQRADIVDEVLQDVAPRLAAGREIRRAEPAQAQAALATLRVPPPPSGLTDAQQRRLLELGRRAEAIREVLVVVTGEGELTVAVAADTGLLVLVLPPRPDRP